MFYLKVALKFPFQAIYTQAPHVFLPNKKNIQPHRQRCRQQPLRPHVTHVLQLPPRDSLPQLVVCRNSPRIPVWDSNIDRMPLVALGHQTFYLWVYWICIADWLLLANLRDMENMISGKVKRRCFQEWKLKQGPFEGHVQLSIAPPPKKVYASQPIIFQYQTMHYYKGNPSNLP